jgi:hypothetical protein
MNKLGKDITKLESEFNQFNRTLKKKIVATHFEINSEYLKK